MEKVELTAEQIAEQKAFEARKARVTDAAKKIARVVSDAGLNAQDFDWAHDETKRMLVLSLPETSE